MIKIGRLLQAGNAFYRIQNSGVCGYGLFPLARCRRCDLLHKYLEFICIDPDRGTRLKSDCQAIGI